jgi:hypothetical protein
VLANLACAITYGGEAVSDFRVLGDQGELFGPVASVPTVWRTLSEIAGGGDNTAARLRECGWPTRPWRACIRLDASIVICHSEKEQASPTWKRTFSFHPLMAYADNTGEPLAGKLRKGSAGSNTAADHLQVLDDAIAALPPKYRRKLMVTADGAGASHALITRLDELACRCGYELTYSVGWELGERERGAIKLVPEPAWQIAIDPSGEVRERRADATCGDAGCCHRECWVEEAHVTELTAILRPDTGHDQLAGWPKSMRVFARRERPHPGAQLSLFEADDGYRYVLSVTNLPATTRGGGGDRRHAADLAQVHRPRRRPRQGRAQDPALPSPARRRPAGARRTAPPAEDRRHLALGRPDRRRLDTHRSTGARALTSVCQCPAPANQRHPRQAEPPDTRPGSRATVMPKPYNSDQLRSQRGHHAAALRPRE